MKEDKINNIYTAEDIEQYFLGKLLPEQMHAMEKTALDDPFLAEAMEGYGAMKNEHWKKELNELREKFTSKETTVKIVTLHQPFKWWKAVAAILIIGSGATLAYLFTNLSSVKNKTVGVASIKKDSIDTFANAVINAGSTVKKETVASTKNNDKPLIAQVKPAPVADNTFIRPTQKRNSEQQQAIALNDDKQKQQETESLAHIPSSPAQKNTSSQAYKITDLNKAEAQNTVPAADKKDYLLNRSFIAAVTGADKTPLPFANIYIPNENMGTYTDVKGKFRLVAADSVLKIEVRAAGYLPATYMLKSGDAQNTIVLNEVPVAAKDIIKLDSKTKKNGVENRRQKLKFDTVLNVEPADGWSNYDTYLSNNLLPSAGILQKNIHGEVEVSFDVHSNGKLSNLNVARSLCGDCDEEALRVIKDGPQWKVKKGKKDRGKIKVKF